MKKIDIFDLKEALMKLQVIFILPLRTGNKKNNNLARLTTTITKSKRLEDMSKTDKGKIVRK